MYRCYHHLTLVPATRDFSLLPCANSLYLVETPNNSASYPDQSCLTIRRRHFQQIWANLKHFEFEVDKKFSGRQFSLRVFCLLILYPLAVHFEECWWMLQTVWIQMRPHGTRDRIWDPNWLTTRWYIVNENRMKSINVCSLLKRKKKKKVSRHAMIKVLVLSPKMIKVLVLSPKEDV